MMFKKIIKDTFALIIISLVSVFLLAIVYEITKEPIDNAVKNEILDSYKKVYPDTIISDKSINNEEIIIIDKEGNSIIISEIRTVSNQTGNIIGKVCSANTYGFGGEILFTVGIDNDNIIKGFSITSASNESPGLGAKCLEESFTNQFVGKNNDIKLNDYNSDNSIDAISNATITSKAIQNAVNAVLDFINNYENEGSIS